MADRSILKTADHNAISDDDPFAELTRIMGFDPRQPVKPQSAQEPVLGDDFDIDLEKELMGEFGLDEQRADDFAVQETGAPESHAVSSHDLDDAVGASFDDFDLEAHNPVPASQTEPDFDLDFGDAVAQSFEPAQPEAAWPTHDEPAHQQTSPNVAAEPDFGSHFDDAMAEVDMDFASNVEQIEQPYEAQPVAALDEPQATGAVVYDEQSDEGALDISAAEFDDLLAAEPAPDAVELIETAEPIAAALYAEPERSLEDELNALLGNMGARVAKPAAEGGTMSRSWASMVNAAPARALDPYAGAGVGYGASQPVQLHATPRSVPETQVEHVDMAADLDAIMLNELSASPENARVESLADEGIPDIAFDDTDFADLDAQHGAEPSAIQPVAEMPSLARSWNLGMPVAPTMQQAFAPEPANFTPAAEPVYEARHEEAAYEAYDDEPVSTASFDEVPDLETVDVPERVVALADDLDIPELDFDRDRPVTTSFDDLDAEFAGMLGDMNAAEAAPVTAAQAPSYDDEPYEAGFKSEPVADQRYGDQLTAHAPTFATAASYDDAGYDAQASRPFAPVDTYASDRLDYDPALDDEMAIPQPGAIPPEPRRRGMLVAAVVGAVAIVGGIGAFALSPGGGANSDAPVIVKADNKPIKVKPEQPGGTVVPNQDNKVYDVVAKGTKPETPTQEKLVANMQEPVDVIAAAPQNRVIDLSPSEEDDIAAAASDTAAPTAKAEDRIDQTAQQSDAVNKDVAVVAPRKVRTMIVKPDGTLAPREDVTPAPVAEASEPTDPAPQQVAAAPVPADDLTGAVQADGNVPPKPAAESALKPAAKPQSATTPSKVAAAPQRPSEQPVDIVGEVKPDQVASISPAAAAGAWSMQIASQPTEASAQSSYKDLARRYASVLEGQPVSIVKAEIAGKGTFYRVRVAANSRNDAIKLCESYKAAGGNCFVSK